MYFIFNKKKLYEFHVFNCIFLSIMIQFFINSNRPKIGSLLYMKKNEKINIISVAPQILHFIILRKDVAATELEQTP